MKSHAPFDALTLMKKLGLEWKAGPFEGYRIHAAGTRTPRLRTTYGPRVTGGNTAWDRISRG